MKDYIKEIIKHADIDLTDEEKYEEFKKFIGDGDVDD